MSDLSRFDFSHFALANAQDEFTAAFIIYLQMIEQLKVVDELAVTTQSIRVINQAHLMRKDVYSLTSDLQRYLSFKALNDSGDWQEMTQNDNALKFHLAVITQTKS